MSVHERSARAGTLLTRYTNVSIDSAEQATVAFGPPEAGAQHHPRRDGRGASHHRRSEAYRRSAAPQASCTGASRARASAYARHYPGTGLADPSGWFCRVLQPAMARLHGIAVEASPRVEVAGRDPS